VVGFRGARRAVAACPHAAAVACADRDLLCRGEEALFPTEIQDLGVVVEAYRDGAAGARDALHRLKGDGNAAAFDAAVTDTGGGDAGTGDGDRARRGENAHGGDARADDRASVAQVGVDPQMQQCGDAVVCVLVQAAFVVSHGFCPGLIGGVYEPGPAAAR
jgi:hypothetical protein